MHKITILITALLLSISLLGANALNREYTARPLFAVDRIKVKLSNEAVFRANLPTGLYAQANRFNINELDQLMSVVGGKAIIRAHRRVKDTDWEKSTGWDRWFLITLNGKTSATQAIEAFKANRYVEDATPEYIAYREAIPNDTYYANNWGHNNTAQLPVYSGGSHSGAGVGAVGFDSDAQLAWDQTQGYGLQNIVIAVIDTGVDTAHPDLRLVTGYDYGDNDSNPMDDSGEAGHGTCCSGIAAGKANNSLGVTGVAGGCSVMPLKVADSAGNMYFTAIENALTHAADYNANIVSMSLGAEGGMGEGDSPSTDAALTYAYNAGVAIFAATANSNTSTIAYPSNHTAVISVGAASPCGQRKSTSSCDGEYWWGSNYGTNTPDDKDAVDIMGPTILPATDISGTGGYSSSDYYMWFNGTSCATPYVAGSAALILSRDASLTPSQLRAVMTSTATDMTADGGAGWDRYTGYGMVNVYSAITSLSAYNPPLGLIAIAGNAVVTLNWQPPATGTPVNYKIYKNSVLLTTTTELTYTDTNVVNGITYAYFLKAVYSEGESDPTATVYATPSPVSYAILGSGSSTTNNNQLSPINNTFKSIHGQSVYTAAELNAAGIYGPKMLTKFGFYPVSQPNLALVNFIVRMKHTTQTDASTWDDGSNLTTVYSNTAYMPTVGGYDMLTLTTPFEWNGTDNILIDTAFGMLANYSQTGTLQYTSVNNGYCRVGDDNTNQTNLFTGGAVRNFRPNVRLGFEAIVLGPIIAVDPASLAFGTQQVGTSAVLPFTIHNTGDQTLSGFISSPAGFSVAQARGAEDMEISANAGSSGRNTILYSIAAGVTKTYNLTFTPTAANTYSGNVVISSNDSGSPSVNIAVSGSGYIPPTIVLNPVSLEVSLHSGESASDGFEVANGGSQTLNFVISEMPPVDWFSASPMIGTVPGSGSQPVSCSFSAAGLLPGIYETLLQIASNDPINPLSEISIILNVLNYAPEIDVPESFSFDMDGSLVVDFSPFVSDPDNQDLILGCSGNANVQVSIDGLAVTFTAAAGWSGSEELTFSVSDGIDQSFDTATVTVNLVSLAQPEILAITKSAGGILIEWEPVANAAQFKIYRATEPDGDFILLATTTQNSYEDTAALDKAFYRIVADSVPPAK